MNHRTRVPGETPDTATGTVALPGSKDSAFANWFMVTMRS